MDETSKQRDESSYASCDICKEAFVVTLQSESIINRPSHDAFSFSLFNTWEFNFAHSEDFSSGLTQFTLPEDTSILGCTLTDWMFSVAAKLGFPSIIRFTGFATSGCWCLQQQIKKMKTC